MLRKLKCLLEQTPTSKAIDEDHAEARKVCEEIAAKSEKRQRERGRTTEIPPVPNGSH